MGVTARQNAGPGRRSPARLGSILRGVPLAIAAALSIAACEPRIEEPHAAARSTTIRADGATPARPDAPSPASSTASPCVRPTPAQAERTVTGPIPAPGCPADPGPRPDLPRGKVRFPDAPPTAGGSLVIDAEIAETDAHRQRGLMYRTSLPDTEGMLFIFERSRKLSFWMRNTCLPLDMIFVAEDGTIVHIEENTPTLTDQTFPSGCPAKYVVEVAAGWTRARGVKAGQKLAIER